jgi:hypothetical protein
MVRSSRSWDPSERFARRGGGLLLPVFKDSKPKNFDPGTFRVVRADQLSIKLRRRRR